MKYKLRHLGILFFDLLSIVMLWIGYDNIKQIFMEINDQVEILRFGNRDGFFIVGIGIPLMHLLIIIEQLWPEFLKKFEKQKKLINNCVLGCIVAILFSGFAISSWLQNRAESVGYVYCWYVSGSSALAKTLVYTKGQEICEELETEVRAERKR